MQGVATLSVTLTGVAPGTHTLGASFAGGSTYNGISPAGVLTVQVEVEEATDGWQVRRAAIERTARRLVSGLAYVPRSVLDEP